MPPSSSSPKSESKSELPPPASPSSPKFTSEQAAQPSSGSGQGSYDVSNKMLFNPCSDMDREMQAELELEDMLE